MTPYRVRRLICGALLIASLASHAMGGMLPTGGTLVTGTGGISQTNPYTLTITQSSAKAIINWSSFSIGQGSTVQFNNGSGATLNRVTGASISQINGLLSATGSVYVVNPNGVIISKTGVVNTGGSFVASTLDVTNDNFLAGGPFSFTGASTASVVNLGKIGSLGGNVALIAQTVTNAGTITAADGTIGLASGSLITLADDTADDGGLIKVQIGEMGDSLTNEGALAAAAIELRAQQGNIYALAGNTGGTIDATGVANKGGKVFLVAQGGTLSLAGDIVARGAGGKGGSIETSGSIIQIGQANIDAGAGGSWLLDPNDLTIDQTAADIIAATLNGGTNVTQQTTASGIGGNGDISVAPSVALDWTTNASLTLSAYRNISFGSGSSFASTGGGAIVLYADNTGTGIGTVSFGSGSNVSTTGAVNIFYNPPSNPAGSAINATSYTIATDYAGYVTGGGALTAFMLVNTLDDLQNVENNLAGTYALGANIDAGPTAGWNAGAGFTPLGSDNVAFSGLFNGQGNTISGLNINRPAVDYLGLFGETGPTSIVENVGLIGGDVTGRSRVGALVGLNAGAIVESYASSSIDGSFYFGGLVGYNTGVITRSYDTGTVYTDSGTAAGGLVGINISGGSISQSYATGSVRGDGFSNDFGGLVGHNSALISQSYATGSVSSYYYSGGLVGNNYDGSITQSYSTGAVSGPSGGGLVGFGYENAGSVASSYWDITTSGLSASNGGTGLTTSQFASISNFAGFTFGTTPGASGWVIVDADGSLNNSGGVAGATRPLLLSEYSTNVTNAHQLQLMELDLNANYSLASDIDASATAGSNPSDIWITSGGFVPIGGAVLVFSYDRPSEPLFTGIFDGEGHTVSGLTINRPSQSSLGLFGGISSTAIIENVGLIGGSVSGYWDVGDLVGFSEGAVLNSFATGAIFGTYETGGLVGLGQGDSISDSYASGSVTGASGYSDGLGGLEGFITNDGRIARSYATGSVTGNGGAVQFGGLVGGVDVGTITQSYATGAVNGGSYSQYIGGLVGTANGATISQTYATGSVTGTYEVGGLAGWQQNGGSISQSYAAGAVSGSANVGGLVGVQDPTSANTSYTVTSSYWDTVTSGQSASAGGVGLTTAQMQNPATFMTTYVGWDFANVWSPPSAGYYPELYFVSHVLRVTPDNQTMVYGAALPVFTASYYGFEGGDGTSDVSGLTLSSIATSSSSVGSYPINGAGASATGGNGAAYRIIYAPGALSITPATLTATLTGTVSKAYDDTTSATLTPANYSLSGVVNGDTVSLNDPTSGTYNSLHAGTGLTVTVTGLAITNNAAGNYVLGNPGATASAAIGTITPEAITVTASANSKVYNGTLIATATPTVTTGTLYAGDGTLAETYASKDVGSTITLTPTATLATPGDYAVTYVSANTGVITPATLTASLTGTVSKTYNDSTAATLTAGNYTLSGVVNGDTVSLNDPTSGTYSTLHAGTGLTVTVSGLALTNNAAGDYVLGNAGATATAAIGTITPEAITVTASANSKVYNGTLVAAATPTVTTGTLYAGDGTLAEAYASKDVGSAISLTPTAALATPGDYSVTYVSTNSGVITPASLTATVVGNVTKVYDSNNVAPLTGANIALAGVVAGDSVSATNPSAGQYATANVGTGILVGATGFSLTGASAKDYTVANAFAFGNVGTITPEAITVTASANTKVYNGTLVAAATPTVTSGTLYSGDGTLSETYASKDVGAAITLTPAVALVDPADYKVTLAATNTGVITPASLTATVVGNVTKVYDSNNVAPLTGANIALAGVVAGDSVSATNPSAGQYATVNVGSGILVGATGFGLTGASAKDYTVANAFAFGNVGTITPEPITVTATANSKVYNGTTAAAATPTVTSGKLYAGDGTLSETYASKNVGSAITLTPAVALVDPADYTVTLAATNTGVITPATLNVSLTGTVSKVYNGTTVATLSAGNYSVTGVIGSDQVSVANTSGTYATKNVAYAIPVTVSGLTLAGAQAQDYVVNVTSVTASIGTITPDIIQTTPTTFAAGDLQYLQLSAQAPGDYGLSETVGGTTLVIADPSVPKYGSPAIP